MATKMLLSQVSSLGLVSLSRWNILSMFFPANLGTLAFALDDFEEEKAGKKQYKSKEESQRARVFSCDNSRN